MGAWGRLSLVAALLTLSACASETYTPAPERPLPERPGPRAYAPPPEEQLPAEGARLSDLPGWLEEDHAAALAAFAAGCGVSHDAALLQVCREARDLGRVDDRRAADFLDRHFTPRRLEGDGVLTGYFVPEYEAREAPEPPFTAAVRPSPSGIEALTPLGDRAAIEASPPEVALAWMKPEDLFFMQIQGSGVLDLPDGQRLKASFSSTNNQPFVAIARILRERGELTGRGSSAEAIRGWLADHRGPDADAVMQLDPRYVFFTVAPDDGREPAGTAGAPLVAGRSIAVDASLHDLGDAYWIDADAPTLAGAPELYRRMVMALDTGGAIKGLVRADLYLGRGPQAGDEAGRVKHVLHLYALTPRP